MPDFSQIQNELLTGILKDGQRVDLNSEVSYLLKGLGGAVFSQQLRISYLFDQILPSTSDEKYLLIHGRNKRVVRGAGSKARGSAIARDSTTTIPNGTLLVSSVGNEYIVTGLQSGQTYAVESVDIGSNKNLDAGATLRLVKPVNVTREMTILDELTGGSDIESLEEYRERVVTAWQNPGEYGSVENYYEWLRSRQELSKSFVFEAHPYPGVVSWAALVRSGIDDYIFPNAAIISEINKFLDTKRPPGARIQFLTEAKIIRLNMVLSGVPVESREPLKNFIRNQLFRRAVVKGASLQGTGELIEGTLRNIIASFLQGVDFDVLVKDPSKLGIGALAFGEIILAGEITYA